MSAEREYWASGGQCFIDGQWRYLVDKDKADVFIAELEAELAALKAPSALDHRAVRTYREGREGSLYAVTALSMAMLADNAIAELEENLRGALHDVRMYAKNLGEAEDELAALRAQYDACQKTCLQRDALVDELDELKARRCETCVVNNDCEIQNAAQAGDLFYCAAWLLMNVEARAEEGAP
jgi:chromosome segregation ATPase